MKVLAFIILPLILLVSHPGESLKIKSSEKNLRHVQQALANRNQKILQKRGVLLGNAFSSNQALGVWPKLLAGHYGYNLNAAIPVDSTAHHATHSDLYYKPVSQLAAALTPTYVLRPGGSITEAYNVHYPHTQQFRPNVHYKPIHSLAALTPVESIHPSHGVSSFQSIPAIPADFRPPSLDCHTGVIPQQTAHVFQTAFVPAAVAPVAPQSVPLVPFEPAAPALPALPAIPAFPAIPNFPSIPDIPNIPAIPSIPNIQTQSLTPGNSFIPISFQPPLPHKPPTFVTSSGSLVPVATKPDAIAGEASRPFATPAPVHPHPHPVPLLPPLHTPAASYGPPTGSSNRPFHTLLPPYSHQPNEAHIPPAVNQHQLQPFHGEGNLLHHFARDQEQQLHHHHQQQQLQQQQQQQNFLQDQSDQQQLAQQTDHYQNYQAQY